MPHRRQAEYRRALRWAIPVAVVAHALVLWLVSFPPTREAGRSGPLVVTPTTAPAPERPPGETARPEGGEGKPSPPRSGRRPAASVQPAVPIPVETPGAPETGTIPSTELRHDLLAPTLPLEAADGTVRRRAPDPARLARVRAESLANARLASLPGASGRDIGAVGLANGGVTIAIPWGGFVRRDRTDDRWREKRCSGKESDKGDKAGEAEARRAQCD